MLVGNHLAQEKGLVSNAKHWPLMKLVTIAIPVYKRFDFLPKAIQCVASQDYPYIELIVSDNGQNGTRVPDIVRQHYPGPFRFRQNLVSVPIPTHFNQLLQEAAGEYYVVLCDDHEISSNYVSELVGILESYPRVSIALARQEIMDAAGRVTQTSSTHLPEQIAGEQFIQLWCARTHGYQSWVTFLGRTKEIRKSGGLPEFTIGTHSDNALMVKLCLGNQVAFNQRCAFRYRMHEESAGLSAAWEVLMEGTKSFLGFLDSDPYVLEFARAHPERWAGLKEPLRRMIWETYLDRLESIYRKRLPWPSWFRAAFAMPFIPAYYFALFRSLIHEARTAAAASLKKVLPRTYRIYRSVRYPRNA